jgi:hypothetical protein
MLEETIMNEFKLDLNVIDMFVKDKEQASALKRNFQAILTINSEIRLINSEILVLCNKKVEHELSLKRRKMALKISIQNAIGEDGKKLYSNETLRNLAYDNMEKEDADILAMIELVESITSHISEKESLVRYKAEEVRNIEMLLKIFTKEW